MNCLNLLIDVNDITRIVDITCTALFASILVILILCFLRGLLRGWKNGTYNLIATSILVMVALLTLTPIANLLGTIDISFIGSSQTVTLGDISFTFSVTTLQPTIQDFFVQFFKASGYQASPSDIVSYSTALSYSVIKLVLILVDAILIFTLGKLFLFILWHLIFKRFTPKEKRKKKSLRLVSAFEEVVVGALALVMFLSPLTGLVNSMAYNADLKKEEADKNEYASLVYGVLESYKNSVFSNVFFSYAKQDGTNSLDTQLLSFLTESKVDEYSTSLVKEVGSAASLASTLVNSGLLSLVGGEELSWRLFFASSTIPSLLTYLADMDLVKVALPVVVTILTNMDQTKSILGEDTVSYLSRTDIDWSNELKTLSNIYTKLVDADLFEVLVEEETKTPVFDLSYIFNMFDEEENRTAFNEALSFADSELSRHLIAGVMYSLCSKETKDSDPKTVQLIDFMPKNNDGNIDYDSFASFNWVNELKIVYDSFYSLVQIDKEEMKEVFDCLGRIETSSNRKEAAGDASSLVSDQITKKMTTFLVDHVGEVSAPLIGDINSIDGDGVSISDTKCLLDSALIANFLPEVVPLLASSLDNISLDKAQESLIDTSGDKSIRGNFKKEFSEILGVVSDFASTDSGKAFIKDFQSMPGINFDPDGKLYSIDVDLADGLKKGLTHIDNSFIAKELIPSYVDNILKDNESIKEYFPDGLNTSIDGLGSELAKIIDLVTSCPNLIRLVSTSSFSSVDSILDFLSNNGDELKTLLKTVCSSRLLFSSSTSEDDPGVDSSQFAELLNALTKGFKENMFTPEDIKQAKDENGSLDKEIDAMVDVLVELSSSGAASSLINMDTSDYSSSINALSKLNIKDTFAKLDSSSLMRKMVSDLLDTSLDALLGDELDSSISFKNVTSWENEGAALDSIVKLATKGLDLSNIDFFSSGTLLTDMLKALAKSGIFMDSKNDRYLFPEFVYNKLISSLDSSTLKFFADKDADLSIQSKEEATSLFKSSLLDYSCISDGSSASFYGEGGELDKICDVLNSISSLGGLDKLTNLSSSITVKLERILKQIAASSTLGRVLLYNGINEAIKSIPSSSEINFAKANTTFFYDESISISEKQEEISNLMEIISLVYDDATGLIKDGGIDLSKLDIDSISVEFFLRPLLETMKDSKIFGVDSSDIVASNESNRGSVFGDLMLTLVDKSSIYNYSYYPNQTATTPKTKITGVDEQINSHTSLTKLDLVNNVTSWDDELDNIFNILNSIQRSSLIKKDSSGNISIDTSFASSPESFFGNDEITRTKMKESLNDILGNISSSKLFGYALPNQIESMLFKVGPNGEHYNVMHIAGDDGFINDFLWAADPYYNINSNGDYLPYSQEEIDNLTELFYNFSYCASLDANNINSIDVTHLMNGLENMSRSGIFNSQVGIRSLDERYASSYESVNTFFNNADSSKNLTCFQAIMSKIIDIGSLNPYLYNSNNPNDSSFASSMDKVMNQVRFAFKEKYDQINETPSYLTGPSSLGKFYQTLQNAATDEVLTNGGTKINFDSITSEGLETLFHALDNCYFYKDVIPNALYELLNGEDYSISGIDLNKANFFAKYKLSEAEWSGEIDLICSLLPMLRDNINSLSKTDEGLTDLDPLLLRSILTDLSESKVFNSNYDDASNDLTVFEQFIYSIYDKSGLASKAFSISSDGSSYLTSSYTDKLTSRIKNFSGSWINEINGLTYGYDKVSNNEYGLIYDAKKFGLLSGGEINIGDSLMSLEPSKIAMLFKDINRLSIVEDALSNTISSLLTNTGLNQFSIYEFDLTGAGEFDFSSYFKESNTPSINNIRFTSNSGDYSIKFIDGTDLTSVLDVTNESSNTYSIDTKDLRDGFILTGSDINSVHVSFDLASYSSSKTDFDLKDIPALESLLTSMYDETSKEYFDFNKNKDGSSSEKNDFCDFLLEGHSTSGIFSFLKDSSFYSNGFNYDGSSIKLGNGVTNFNANGYVMTKLLNVNVSFASTPVNVSLSNNFRGNNQFEKASTATDIFANENHEFDSTFFDNHIFSSAIFQAYLDLEKTASSSAQFGIYNGMFANLIKGNEDSPDKILQKVDIIDYLISINSSSSSNIGFANEIVSGQLDDLVSLNMGNINRYSVGGSLSMPLTSRSSFLPSISPSSFRGEKGALNKTGVEIANIKNMMYFMYDLAMSNNDVSYIDGLDMSNPSERIHSDIIYLGSIYDMLCSPSIFASKTNDMFDMKEPTNYLNGVGGQAFSYASIASIIAA